MPQLSSYALITPARNEAQHIVTTIASVAAQTHAPARWIIVDDGSTDQTAAIVAEHLTRLPYLRLVRQGNRGHDAVGGGVVARFNDGLRALDLLVPLFGKLDADIRLESDYFARLVAIFDSSPALGIASGQSFVEGPDGSCRTERSLRFHPTGTARLYRARTFDDIGGLVESAGWDTLDVMRARMRGWETRTFDELRILHLRPLGTRDSLRNGVKQRGRSAYVLGYSPLYMAARIAWFAVTQKPRPLHAWWLLRGYASAVLDGETRIATAAERRWLRRFQHRLLLGIER